MNKNIRNTTRNVALIVLALLALIAIQAAMTRPKKKVEKYCSACGVK
jgi:hypothetical protein